MSARIIIITALLLLFNSSFLSAQNPLSGGQIHGSFQTDMQYYANDNILGLSDSSLSGKRLGMNGFLDLLYTNHDFTAGLRYEAYLLPMLGFEPQHEGQGIPYYFVKYQKDWIEVTAGNFYEQFGNGLILRTYQEWNLGYDNSLNGLRVKLNPAPGVTIKGVVGSQRYYWEKFSDGNRGIVRGADGEFYLNDIFPLLKEKQTQIILGGSMVSKYEKLTTKTTLINDSIFQYKLPRNVAAFAGRLNISHRGINFLTEYAYKMNNPSQYNNFIYRPGQALFSTLSYSQKGLGIILAAKRIDNMSFKSKMTEDANVLDINFIPPLTKAHHYSLANMYPYATQLNGEYAFEGDVVYTLPKKSALGGKYGMNIALNSAFVFDIDKQPVAEGIAIGQSGTYGYTSDFLAPGGTLFFREFSMKISKKFTKDLKGVFIYLNQVYDKDIIEGHHNEYGKIYSHIGVADITYKLSSLHSLRLEAQTLLTRQDKGNWASMGLEYTIAPKYFISVADEYNYGNTDPGSRTHYFNVAAGYLLNTTRIAVAYGRQREGIVCVGGVCRQVPASSGLSIAITSSF